MSIFKEVPPTAGFPVYFRDFLSYFKPGSLEKDLESYIGLEFINITYSGTAAFYLILEALKDFSNKKTVVIPGYVCPLVALAVKRAGLKVAVCDIRKDSFDFDLSQLGRLSAENDDILAVVAVHLAGIPLDFQPLQDIVKKRGIFIIEDCAQALGAEYNGKKAGSLGDIAFFSFCRGKGLTIYEGGAIGTNNKELSAALDRKIKLLVKNNFLSEILKILELFGYWIFYRPQVFWFVFRLPQIFWNLAGNRLRAFSEYYTPDFEIHNVSRFRKSVGHAQFNHLKKGISEQREKTLAYLSGLNGIKGIEVIKEQSGMKATYPYLTLVFDQPNVRDRVLKSLENCGLGVSIVYLYAITDYVYLRNILSAADNSNARYLAQRQITLPTGTFLEERDLNLILERIKKAI